MNFFKSQKLFGYRRKGSVMFWGWIASLLLHLVILSVFGVVKFSRAKATEKKTDSVTATATIKKIQELIKTSPVIPKPKVYKTTTYRLSSRTNKIAFDNQLFDAPTSSYSTPDFSKAEMSTAGFSKDYDFAHRNVEFFGNRTQGRRICYVVDCSGSMRGMFSRVQRKLKDSIGKLQADHYFYIIFFGGDKLREFRYGKLVRAGSKAKTAAFSFIDSVQPYGKTDAMAALERAVMIRDNKGICPSVIYFLTDGFELTTDKEQPFLETITQMLNTFAPQTKINTIAFWAQADDKRILEIIAQQSGGKFVPVKDQ